MAQPYVGEIRMFAGNFAPAGWMFCQGDLLPISEYETLFQLIGTTYGGDGQSTFQLPDLRGRLPLHQGSGYILSETGGSEQVTLTLAQIPAHRHTLRASADPAAFRSPFNHVAGRTAAESYASEFTPQPLAPEAMSVVGGNQPHSNLQPALCVHFIISIYGIFPSPT